MAVVVVIDVRCERREELGDVCVDSFAWVKHFDSCKDDERFCWDIGNDVRTFCNWGDIGAIGIFAAIFNFDDERAEINRKRKDLVRKEKVISINLSSFHHLLLHEFYYVFVV